MRVTRERAGENRRAVIDAAGRLFRERGVNGIGIDDLMRAAGLTRGAFYKQFTSRDDLVRQAMARALSLSRQNLADRIATSTDDPLATLVHGYLSADHRERIETGCAFAAVGCDAVRSGDVELKAIFNDAILAYLALIRGILPPEPNTAPDDRAMIVLSTLIGALLVSRLVTDPQASDRVLAAVTAGLLPSSDEEAASPLSGRDIHG